MNYLDDKDYEDVSFIKKHPEIKSVDIGKQAETQ